MIDVFAIVEDLRRRLGHGRVSFIELDRSSPDEPATALLVFADGAPEPRALVKATTNAARALRMKTEHENLARLHEAGVAGLREAIPQPLYFDCVGTASVAAQSAIAGTRIKDFPPEPYFASARFRGHFATVVGLLDDLAQVREATTIPGAAAAERATEQIARYRQHHSTSAAVDALLADAVRHLKTIEVPLTPWHGDFCTANLLVDDRDRVSIIDWEYPLEPNWPLGDLLYFVSSTWCVPYHKGRAALLRNQRRLFFEPHAFADLIRESTLGYGEHRGLGRLDLLPLAALAWVAYANRKHAELGAGAALPESEHQPLILIGDGACSNLEILAERRETFLAAG